MLQLDDQREVPYFESCPWKSELCELGFMIMQYLWILVCDWKKYWMRESVSDSSDSPLFSS